MAGATWTATKITATAAENMQTEAGLLLNTFDVSDPDEPTDAEIICATSGDFSISCTPEVEDFFEDVNNAPNNTKEGKRINGWNCELSVECLEFTIDTLELALGAARAINTTGTAPRGQYELSDFKTLWWIGDLIDKEKLLVVKMGDAVSTGGINFSTGKRGKGRLSLTITVHPSLATPDVMPMEFYILTKGEGMEAVTVASAAGTTTGYTAITVSGYTLGSGESWVYKVDDGVSAVTYGQDLIRWTEWDGDDEIAAATGKVITVAAVDTDGYAVAAGYATVTAKAAS